MKQPRILLFCLLAALPWPLRSACAWQLAFVMETGPAGRHLAAPTGLSVDAAAGRYYIVDSGHGRLLSFDRDGKPLRAFDAGGRFQTPVAMVRAGKSRLLVAEKGRATLTLVDLKARKVRPIEVVSKLDGASGRIIPSRMRRYGKSVFVTDSRQGLLFRLGRDLTPRTVYRMPEASGGVVDFSLGDDAVAILTRDATVRRYAVDGTIRKTVRLDPAPDFAAAFAVAKSGLMAVAERHAGVVRLYGPDGKARQTLMEPGAKAGRLRYPVALLFDPWGRLCVLDEGNGRATVLAP